MASPLSSSSPPPPGAMRPSPWTFAFYALAALVAIVWMSRSCGRHHPLVGHPAPDFSLDVVHNGDPGSKLHLATLQGHPVLLDFWATWCGPCRAEAPILERVAQHYRERGLIVVGVNTGDKPGLASVFAARTGLSYPIVFDEANVSEALYQVDSLPTLVVVARDGTVRAVRMGTVSERALNELVESVL